ncbi:unnamed protein product [Adineta steineri]|uniref:non-specific serine/threonine protein kinase n=1 Tax=Adineta steineri TaxID=433720 RepID=A0A814TMU5_9BILA|nr:unnamed protein product [Adineta steineri]CAF1164470.1 unnamed protein product [Adineta steineri]CAF1521509.1 unnamed protein product [Adineta steineri]
MIRPQKIPVRSGFNQSVNDINQSSTNVTDITSYIGKILTINHHQVIVEDILGQGGFAFVFLVRSYNQQKYALKRMYVNNQRDLQICQREISFVKEFSSHPNIVKYVDSFIHRVSPINTQKRYYYNEGNGNDDTNDDDDAVYEILLLTEYCLHGALITRLNEQRNVGITLNERQIIRIFADVCNAVSACHFRRPQPILHRDIKLENILIDSHQTHVLCDFGSAILLPSSTTNDFQQYPINQLTTSIIQQLEEEIQRYTTLSYRAPEMIDLYSRLPITLKADIWAMGCLLYKLMYNTMPFGESILAIQNGTFVIPDDTPQVYSRELNLLVRYMLEIDINKRPDIWQVSYATYKLLGIECPIPNRCQSKIPEFKTIPMPLTESESRYQRDKNTLSKTKSTSTNVLDESLSFGTAVNPRERPRGMIAPSTSLINFNQPNQQSSALVVPPPQIPNPSRSGSAAQLMFDDDFSKIPSHAISLTNIPAVTSTTSATTNEQIVSRARPSPPTTISAGSGFTLQQQLFPPPPSSSNIYTHRRSSSQTVSPSNVQSSFHNASSVDITIPNEASSGDDADYSKTNLNQFKNHNYLTMNSQFSSDDDQILSPMSDDDKSFSSENRNLKINSQISSTSKSIYHHPSTEEAEKPILFSNLNNKNSVKPLIEFTSIQQDKSNSFKPYLNQENNLDDSPTNNNYNQFANEDSNSELNRTTKSFQHSTNINNPFLRAPFHHSPANKQMSTSSTNIDRIANTINPSLFDANSIVIGKKSSAFAPYQKQEIKSNNFVIDATNNIGTSKGKLSHSESFSSETSSPTTNVFTNAPFKTKSKSKQRSLATNINSTSPLLSSNKSPTEQTKNTITDANNQQRGYSNLSFNDAIVDDYF